MATKAEPAYAYNALSQRGGVYKNIYCFIIIQQHFPVQLPCYDLLDVTYMYWTQQAASSYMRSFFQLTDS